MRSREAESGRQGEGRWARIARAALASLCLVAAAGLAATPEEDFRRGEAAHRAGDVVGAMAPLRLAADAGHAAAQVLLAEILDRAELDEEAIGYYRRAAAQGYAAGEFGLGTMLLAGEGAAPDRVAALSWVERAANRGYAPAIITLSQLLMNPPPGESAGGDAAATLRWAREAAALDHLPAMDWLAAAYRSGASGVAPDPREAQAWSEKARQLRAKQAGSPPRRKR